MSKNILFVDDEPSILGIYEMLQPFLGSEYRVSTSLRGEDALQIMDAERFDVVVSDLTMPEMSGVDFLTEVAARHPATARIVVSGFADEITSAKCVMIAHRYFKKPFNPSALTNVILSLCKAQCKAASERIREYVGKLESVPTLSSTYKELTRALRSHHFSIADVSAIIEKDLALTAKVLQMVNTARFAQARRINSVGDAVQIIGFELIRALVLGIQVFEACDKSGGNELFQQVWNHSLRTALTAKRLTAIEHLDSDKCEEAFLLGLLHDIGKVILAACCPEYHALWSEHGHDSAALVAHEAERFRATHAEVGAYLLRLWGLPDSLADAVEAHHHLETLAIQEFTPLVALHLAQELSQERSCTAVNLDVIEHAGLTSHLEQWKQAIRAEEAKGAA